MSREDEIEKALRSLVKTAMNGFDAIEQCVGRDTLEFDVIKAAEGAIDRETSKLWSLVILKKEKP